MTNRFAILFGLTLVIAILGDLVLNNGQALLFLARKLFVLLDFLAFWH